jgi:ubiquinone/menaquinone biosynthesis C-methylase UbiE
MAEPVDSYNVDARSYETLYREEQLDKLKAVLKIGWLLCERILDAGCGTGLLTKRLAKRADFVVGLDVSIGMIRHGGRKGKVNFVLGDANCLPFRDEGFDCYASFTAFHHFNGTKAAKEATRVVRKRGHVIITLFRMVAQAQQEVLEREEGLKLLTKGDAGKDILLVFMRAR